MFSFKARLIFVDFQISFIFPDSARFFNRRIFAKMKLQTKKSLRCIQPTAKSKWRHLRWTVILIFNRNLKYLAYYTLTLKLTFLSWSLVGKVVLQMSSDVASLNFISNTTFGSTTFELTTPASNDAPTLSKSVFGVSQLSNEEQMLITCLLTSNNTTVTSSLS